MGDLAQLSMFMVTTVDPPWRDNRDAMAYPLLSLEKQRTTPIKYQRNGVSIGVHAPAEFGIATIWDWDLIIFAASHQPGDQGRTQAGAAHLLRPLRLPEADRPSDRRHPLQEAGRGDPAAAGDDDHHQRLEDAVGEDDDVPDEKSLVMELLGHAAKFTVVVAVISGAVTGIRWQLEADNRAKERHYRAWDLINAARGSTGDGGRKDALQDLNADRVSLAAAPLEQAYLPGVDLKGAFLVGANLQGAYLADANLQGALFVEANLQGSNLEGVNLQGAHYLPQEQLNAANGNDRTVLPEGLTRPAHWSKAEGRGPSATQPDAR